jgi:3-hydroxybutyryl-CoA dehydrogenase
MEVSIAGIAGLGLLGRGIASCLLAHGITVIAYDVSPDVREKARQSISAAIGELIERGYCDRSLRDGWSDLYIEVVSLDDFSRCNFLIESIAESPQAKSELFDQLEAIVAADTPIASNTSALPITLLQRDRKHPERFVGMHWAEPAHATRFLELIRGEQTSDACMQAAAALALRLGKDPSIVQQDIPGFIANRLGYAMYREACYLLTTGVADAETIDRSFRNSVGLWASLFGPFRWIDLTGGPALYGRAMTAVLPTLSNEVEVPEPMRSMMRQGVGGMRDGHGFFDYTPEQSAHWEELYRQQAWRVRELSDETLNIPSDAK